MILSKGLLLSTGYSQASADSNRITSPNATGGCCAKESIGIITNKVILIERSI